MIKYIFEVQSKFEQKIKFLLNISQDYLKKLL